MKASYCFLKQKQVKYLKPELNSEYFNMLSISVKLAILKLLNVKKDIKANFSKLSIEISRIMGQWLLIKMDAISRTGKAIKVILK